MGRSAILDVIASMKVCHSSSTNLKDLFPLTCSDFTERNFHFTCDTGDIRSNLCAILQVAEPAVLHVCFVEYVAIRWTKDFSSISITIAYPFFDIFTFLRGRVAVCTPVFAASGKGTLMLSSKDLVCCGSGTTTLLPIDQTSRTTSFDKQCLAVTSEACLPQSEILKLGEIAGIKLPMECLSN